MRLSCGLELQQTQKLIITPELRQAITVLQLGITDLLEYIEQEVLQNPLLELSDERENADHEGEQSERLGQPEQQVETDWLDFFGDSSDLGYISQGRYEDSGPSVWEQTTSRSLTLRDYLLEQLGLLVDDETEMAIGSYLVNCIDDNGYLRCSIEEVSAGIDVSLHKVQAVLDKIQTLDPPGVGARNLSECLLLQMDYLGNPNPLAREIVQHHLRDLAEGRFGVISRALKCSLQQVQAAADFIRSLDPKPGRRFGGSNDIQYVVPDVIVERVDDDYVIIVNDSLLPRLLINNKYKEMLKDSRFDPEARRFLENKMNSALWLLKSIEQRRMTLYKVMESIVRLQREFFDYGLRSLKPMTLKQVASMIGVHESTVSRAASNKYVQTPHGVFEIKFLFQSGVNDQFGGKSSQSIKRLIKEIISQEDRKRPYSDQRIATMLKNKGIPICRRTVTKYREELRIPCSTRRKRIGP